MKFKLPPIFRKIAISIRSAFRNVTSKFKIYVDTFCIARVKKMPQYKLLVCKVVNDAETQVTSDAKEEDLDWDIVPDIV